MSTKVAVLSASVLHERKVYSSELFIEQLRVDSSIVISTKSASETCFSFRWTEHFSFVCLHLQVNVERTNQHVYERLQYNTFQLLNCFYGRAR
jgi:hypothetical protein